MLDATKHGSNHGSGYAEEDMAPMYGSTLAPDIHAI